MPHLACWLILDNPGFAERRPLSGWSVNPTTACCPTNAGFRDTCGTAPDATEVQGVLLCGNPVAKSNRASLNSRWFFGQELPSELIGYARVSTNGLPPEPQLVP